MKSQIKNSEIFVSLICIFYFLFLIFNLTNAQTKPQFLISWRAQNYAPSWYQGKILPLNGTPVEISFELIDNDKIADLSNTKVRWYVDDKLAKNENDGLGIKSLRVISRKYMGQDMKIRIALVDYKGSGQLDKIISIPVVGPEVVINAPYYGYQIKTGENSFQALPFFFNIEDLNSLSFEWLTNEQKAGGYSEKPWLVKLNIGPEASSGFIINLKATVRNLLNELEFASKNVQLTIK